MPARAAAAFTICQIALGVIPSPQTSPYLFTRRKIRPVAISAAVIHSSTTSLAQIGTGTGRIRFPFPARSAITRWSSRTWRSSLLSPTSSARLRPHASNSANAARSRFSRRASMAGATFAAGDLLPGSGGPPPTLCCTPMFAKMQNNPPSARSRNGWTSTGSPPSRP